jgi:predicted nucleotidyltransferase
MISQNVLESIFGSPAKIRILRVLSSSPQPLSGRQVGELSLLSHRGAIQALESLVELGAVRQRRVGAAYQYSLSHGNMAVETIIAPSLKAEASILDDLKKNITAQFRGKAVSLTLYGSLARGTGKRGSDIDVLAVSRDEQRKKELEDKAAAGISFFRERYNAVLSLHCYTLIELRSKRNLPLIKSVIQEGVTLSGKPLRELMT